MLEICLSLQKYGFSRVPSSSDPVVNQEELKRQHSLAMENLDDFSTFLNTWQAMAEDTDLETLAVDLDLAAFEIYASNAVSDFLETDKAKQDGLSATSLSAHDCAACTISADGIIRQTNLKAHTHEGLIVGKSLQACGYAFATDESTPTFLAKQVQDASSAYQLLQAKNTRQASYVTLALSKMPLVKDAEPLFLVLMIAPPDTQAAIEMLGQKFGLTPSEVEITQSFLDGIPLREIAATRGRSYTTIRNQFQSVLDKSGCASQTALFRLSFSFAQLARQVGATTPSATSAEGRKMVLPRPKGRVVELQLNGDDMGRPLLNFASLFGYGITPDIDAKLRDRGILLISVSRPGFGGTSPALKDQALYDCLAGDVRAALDSLEITQSPAIARASAARPFYNLVARLPDRISNGVVVNGMIPRNFIANRTVASKWTKALMSASIVSYPIAKLILGTGSSLLKRSRGASFLVKMYQDSATDRAALSNPDVVDSIRKGVEQSALQGLTASAEDIVDAFENWVGDLQAVTQPIVVYHGQDDPNVPLDGVRDFVAETPSNVTLTEEPAGGGQLSYSHIDRILDLAFPGAN